MIEENELNEITKELLNRIDILRKNVKNSMSRGEIGILKGITIFEVTLKKLNPSVLDENEITRIEEYVRKYLIEKEEQTQHVDSYVHYGVNRCFLILELYGKNKEKKLTKKHNFLFTFD